MAETKDTEDPKEGEPGFDDAERARAAGIIQVGPKLMTCHRH